MKANLVYSLALESCSPRQFVSGVSHMKYATMHFRIHAQHPNTVSRFWPGSVWINFGTWMSPSGTVVASAGNPAIGWRSNNQLASIGLRGSPEYDFHSSISYIPHAAHVLYGGYVASLSGAIASVHSTLVEWCVGDSHLTPPPGYFLREQVRDQRTADYDLALADLPDINPEDEGRLLSPRFELEDCVNASMQGLLNTIFWV